MLKTKTNDQKTKNYIKDRKLYNFVKSKAICQSRHVGFSVKFGWNFSVIFYMSKVSNRKYHNGFQKKVRENVSHELA